MYPMRQDHNSIKGLIELCRSLMAKKEIQDFVEVGSFCGESALLFHEHLPEANIFCIDPWESGYDGNDVASSHDMKAVEAAFDERTSNCGRVLKMKGQSEDYADSFDLASVDAVYLDGCHTYEAIKKDLQFWLPRCKLAICGHDYTSNWPGVVEAVDELIGTPDLLFCDGSWIKWLN
jgi:hypothetical protein